MSDESVHQLSEALAVYESNQRELQEMLELDSNNEELRTLKVEVDVAIEQMKVKIEAKKAEIVSYNIGDVCQVRWENECWYNCVLERSPTSDNQLWGVRLVGYGISGSVPSEMLRRFEGLKDVVSGFRCCAVYDGSFHSARVDSIVDNGQAVWVTFTDKPLTAKCVKVALHELIELGTPTPAPQRKRFCHTEEEQKARAEAERARKVQKSEKFRQKKAVEAKLEEQQRNNWKAHKAKQAAGSVFR
eukprot:PhM_4_TR17474/c0_g1_i1/m.33062